MINRILKTQKSVVLLVAASMMLASCAAPEKIAYFQDTTDESVSVPVSGNHITLRPEDKIAILVNTPNDQLNSLYNLPYVSQRLGQVSQSVSSNYSQSVSGYTLDSNGDIDFPVLGRLHVAGMTRDEVAAYVKSQLIEKDLAKDAVVTVEFMNLTVSVFGEVTKPGRYAIEKDKLTILDAIGMAGDLTIYGKRENVRVLRTEDGVQKSYNVNLCNARNTMSSPVYFIQQDDVIYVEPNNVRARQSTVNGNNVRSTSFWISIATLAASVITLVMKTTTK